jgi:hypothetical protein
MRDYARRKHETGFLRHDINRAQQTTPCNPSPARLWIDSDLPHPRQVNYQTTIARAKACKAMPSTTNSGSHSNLRGGSDCVLHIAYICAACNQSWRASYHAIPNGTSIFVAAIAWAQQIAFKSPVERRVNLFAGFDHLMLSLQSEPNAA